MIRNRDELLAGDDSGKRATALALLEAGLHAVDPRRATLAALERIRAGGRSLDRVTLLAFGKAAEPMVRAALEVLEPARGLVVTLGAATFSGLEVVRASHPSAEEGALDAGRRAFALAESLSDEDTVVVLVSGGGSAMLESLLPGVPFDAFRALTDALRESGAAIDELNAVRMAFSAIKGGGLSEAFYPARVINVVVSDVPGMAPWLVASGPTLPAEAGAKLPDVRAILERRGVGDLVTPELLSALEREPPERRWDHIVTEIAADSRTARDAMVESARALGLRALAYPRFLTGEARLAGSIFVRGSLRQPTDVIVASGETTVRVAGKGRGGRNQEFVLGAAPLVGEGVLASMGTDGVDGSSPAAGALVDRTLLERAERKRLDRDAALENNDSYSYFAAAGGTLLTGPTGTNVADICVYVR